MSKHSGQMKKCVFYIYVVPNNNYDSVFDYLGCITVWQSSNEYVNMGLFLIF